MYILDYDASVACRVIDMIPSIGSVDNPCQHIEMVAKVSTGKPLNSSSSAKFVKALWDAKHKTPFESVVFSLHLTMPYFLQVHWLRYRMQSAVASSVRHGNISDFACTSGNKELDLLNIQYLNTIKQLALDKKLKNDTIIGCLASNRLTDMIVTINLLSLVNIFEQRNTKHAHPLWAVLLKKIHNSLIEVKGMLELFNILDIDVSYS
jgi:thymidylate synthase ThyX